MCPSFFFLEQNLWTTSTLYYGMPWIPLTQPPWCKSLIEFPKAVQWLFQDDIKLGARWARTSDLWNQECRRADFDGTRGIKCCGGSLCSAASIFFFFFFRRFWLCTRKAINHDKTFFVFLEPPFSCALSLSSFQLSKKKLSWLPFFVGKQTFWKLLFLWPNMIFHAFSEARAK